LGCFEVDGTPSSHGDALGGEGEVGVEFLEGEEEVGDGDWAWEGMLAGSGTGGSWRRTVIETA